MTIGFDQPLYIWDPLIDLRAKKTTREAAVTEIGRRYRSWVEIYEKARAVGKG